MITSKTTRQTKIKKTDKITDAYLDFLNNISENQKAEWIDGKLVIQSPAKARHLEVSNKLSRLMSSYADRYDLGYVVSEKALINIEEGVHNYEPDIVFFSKEKAEEIDDDTSMFGIPDFVVEILSKSTARYDRGVKFDNYEKAGIPEYWIIDAKKRIVEQYLIENHKYRLFKKHKIGDFVSSKVLLDFFIPIVSLFDTYANLAELDRPLRKIFEKEIKQKEKTIEEGKKTIEESKKTIEEGKKTIEESNKTIQEKEKAIQEKDQQLKESIKLMKKVGASIEDIAKATKQSKEFIERC